MLPAAYTMPSFVTEPKNVRSLIGDKAKFKLTFSGNPPPGMLKGFSLRFALTKVAFLSYYLVS
jgi:hypothetical protein